MFRITKRLCHHHSKSLFQPKPCILTKQNVIEKIDENAQKISYLEKKIVSMENNITYLYLINIYIVPSIIILR